MSDFNKTLTNAFNNNDSLLCIGLDPVVDRIPKHLHHKDYSIFAFNKEIIEATHDVVMGYKPNSAFYEAEGAGGVEELYKTCRYIKKHYPELLLILDAKRGDIGSTNQGYIQFAFDYLGADAITLHPYLGKEAVKPFLDRKDKGCIFLCRTSNPGAGEFQDLVFYQPERSEESRKLKKLDHSVSPQDDSTLYKTVARNVAENWNSNDNCMLVVGATYPEELSEVRKVVGDMPILVPGIGAQGGDLEKTLKAGLTHDKSGLIITVSRSIIYAGEGEDFAEKARSEATKLNSMINDFRFKK